IPTPSADVPEADGALCKAFSDVMEPFCNDMEGLRFNAALEKIWSVVAHCNKYIDDSAPWKLCKDPAQKERFATVVYNLCESLRILSILIYPVMPATSAGIRLQLGLPELAGNGVLADARNFGLLAAETKIGTVKPLFPRKE
ncbi:MAG: class I tRNA ligase family protein, partial [bacterium]